MPLDFDKPTTMPRINSGYITRVNTKSLGNHGLFHSIGEKFFNFYDVRVSEFIFPFWIYFIIKAMTSTLYRFISTVIRRGPKKQVCRINTTRIIASMANTQRRVKGSIGQVVTKTMGKYTDTLDVIFKKTITTYIFIGYPDPTPFRLTYFRPKSLFHINSITPINGGVKFHF